jgi:radical SAM protein (TIGR01212 family)
MSTAPDSNAQPSSTIAWRDAGFRYHSLGFYFRQRFGQKVWKVSVDGRFDCPNVDGTVGSGGCIFCNIDSFSPSRRIGEASITRQIDEGTRRLRKRFGADRFIAYFQPATNTHGPVDRLRDLWTEALAHPDVVGLIVGTRPDSVDEPTLALLQELSQETWLSVEFGLQTIHNRSLDWLNRGHDYGAFLDAVERSRRRHLSIGAHVILGIPGETPQDMSATAAELARLRIDSVKLHNLYAVKETRLGEMVADGRVTLPERDEYVARVVDFLERLPAACVIDRLSGDAPPEYLIGPKWCLDKSVVRRQIEAELERRETWQGRLCD